VQDRDIVTMKG